MPIVSLRRCDSYGLSVLETRVRELLEPLGGLSTFVRPGDRVLLKPNLVMPVRPRRAITTHPALVEAMARLVREAGGEPFVIDSPGGPLHNPIGMRRLYRDTGLRAVADRMGFELRTEADVMYASVPEGGLLKQIELLEVMEEADVIIGLPKFKTHDLTTITGAMKLLFGLVPGMLKPGYHSKLENVDRFCDMLLDIIACVKPDLFVMDGVWGLEGEGPSLGGKARELDLLMASADAVAMDAVMCDLIGVDPHDLALFRAAKRRGWWPQSIDVVGDPSEEMEIANFALPPSAHITSRMVETGLLTRLSAWLFVPNPVPRADRCTACGTCVKTCPRDAIRIVETSDSCRVAVVDYGRCIRCYCCQEMCPEGAIDLETRWLGRLLQKLGVQ